MAQQLEIKDGDVIWMSVGSDFPKWPCKVHEIIDDKKANVESFGDNVFYTNKKISTFIKFTENKGTFVASGRKKLKSKKRDLHLFESAIKEAVDYIHAEIDPDFQLQELDTSFNVSLASLDSSMDISDTSIEHTPSITNSSRKRTRKSAQLSAKKYRSASQTSESTPLDTCTLDNMDANTLTPYRKQSLRDQSPSDLKSSPQQSFSEGEVSVTMDCLLKTPTSESLSHNNQPSTELSDSSPQCNISSIPLNTSPCHETETCSTYQSETSDYKTDASQETKVSDYQPDTSDHEAKISVPESETSNVHTETSVDETNVISKSLDEPTTLESTANSASVSPVPNIPDENESESDDDLPQVDFSGQNWTPDNIKPNDIIWAKYDRYPYWPALVHSINTKRKRVQVFFLGWPDEYTIPFNYNKSKKNLLAFNYQNTEKFKHTSNERLDKLKIRDAFNLALNEADQLHLRRENKEIDGPPELQYKLICQRRPLNFFENCFPSRPTRTVTPSSDNNPNMSAFGYDISSAQKELWGDSKDDDQSDVSGDWDDDENETEDTSLPYCFTHIKEQFEQFKPELEKICRGEIYSELHQIYTTGLSKERGAMKYQEKYGPADHLSDKKKMELFYFLQDIAAKVFDGQRNFTYVYDVLLPEAMARTISAIDKCSLEDAWKKLQSKIN